MKLLFRRDILMISQKLRNKFDNNFKKILFNQVGKVILNTSICFANLLMYEVQTIHTRICNIPEVNTIYVNDLNCLKTCSGCVIPLQVVSVRQLRSKSIICQQKKCFRCSSTRFSSLTDDSKNHESITTIRSHVITKKYQLGATYKHEYASKPEDDYSTSFLNVLSKQLEAFYLFSRPHTVIGTVSYISLVT